MTRWLESVLAEKGVSKRELADLIGVNPSQVTRYTTGEKRPSLSTLERIGRALDVDVFAVFPDYVIKMAQREVATAMRQGWLDWPTLAVLLEQIRLERLAEDRPSEKRRP